jgi:mannose-1-phosphate guanylyltransferase
VKAFLFAAGHGARLRPLTDNVPKCLLAICGKPLLGIWLDLLRHYGVDEVLVNVHAHARAVRAYIASQSNGLRVKLFEERELLGSAGTLVANREWVGSSACFWALYADILTNVDLEQILRFHQARRAVATIGVHEVADASGCGIAVVSSSGIVEQFIEKPAKPPAHTAFAGILMGTPALFESIPDKRPADLGRDVLPKLAGRMVAYPIREFLLDIGTPHNYEKAQATWPGLATPVRVEHTRLSMDTEQNQ